LPTKITKRKTSVAIEKLYFNRRWKQLAKTQELSKTENRRSKKYGKVKHVQHYENQLDFVVLKLRLICKLRLYVDLIFYSK